MRKYIVVGLLVLAVTFVVVPARADEEASWLSLAPFPNGQLSLLYDLSVSQAGSAVTTSVLQSDKLALDLRVGYMVTEQENNLWIIGLGLNVEKIDWVSSSLKSVINSLGGFCGWDWSIGTLRYGGYIVLLKMGPKEGDEQE